MMRIRFRARLKDLSIKEGIVKISDDVKRAKIEDAVHDKVEEQFGQIKWLRLLNENE